MKIKLMNYCIMMKIIKTIALLILSYTTLGQNNNILLEEKNRIIADINTHIKEKNKDIASIPLIEAEQKDITEEHDSIIGCKKNEIQTLQTIFDKLKLVDDSLDKVISSYNVSYNNLQVYNTLVQEKIIDTKQKKALRLLERIKKKYHIYDKNTILTELSIFTFELGSNNRVNSIEKIWMKKGKYIKGIWKNRRDERGEVQNYSVVSDFLIKGKIHLIENKNNFLENMTGVNDHYLDLLRFSDSVTKIKRRIDNEKVIIEKSIKELINNRDEKLYELTSNLWSLKKNLEEHDYFISNAEKRLHYINWKINTDFSIKYTLKFKLYDYQCPNQCYSKKVFVEEMVFPILNFNNYGSREYMQLLWEEHVKSVKSETLNTYRKNVTFFETLAAYKIEGLFGNPDICGNCGRTKKWGTKTITLQKIFRN